MRLRSYRPPFQFPLELIEFTIDYLHDSPSTLRACARVSRAWVAPSHFHLFYCHKTTPTKIRNLLKFLRGSPHIARYIREFHLSAGYSYAPNSDWPEVDASLPRLSGRLKQLRKLVLTGIPFSELVPKTRAAFRALFALPRLVDVHVITLRVVKVEHFTTLLCSPLKRLTLTDSFLEGRPHSENIRAIDKEIKAMELQQRSPCRLEYLSSNNSVFIRWLLGTQTMFDISTIRTLDVMVKSKHREELMARLIRRLGPSLEDLTIQLPKIEDWGAPFLIYLALGLTDEYLNDHPDGSPTKDSIDVECNSNIQRLTVRAEFNHPLAPYLKYLLSRLSATNLQQITIFIAVPWSHDAMNWHGWNEVDQVLDGVKFRGLKEVAIVVNADQDTDNIRQHLTDQFPSMYGKGTLDIRSLIV